jgi:hypothetical protein
MFEYNKNMTFFNGDVYDIGQTINGISKFIFIDGKWHYYSDRLMRQYEYDHNDLSDIIYQDKMNGWSDVKFMGNIFAYIAD